MKLRKTRINTSKPYIHLCTGKPTRKPSATAFQQVAFFYSNFGELESRDERKVYGVNCIVTCN